jgi:hypothetical protein
MGDAGRNHDAVQEMKLRDDIIIGKTALQGSVTPENW